MSEKTTSAAVFHGFNHDNSNVQGVDHVASHFEEYLTQDFGRRVLFLEMADNSKRAAEKMSGVIESKGLKYFWADAEVFAETGREPSPVLIEARIAQIEDKIAKGDYSGIINQRLLVHDSFQAYFMARKLDELREKYGPYNVRLEAHSDKTLARVNFLVPQLGSAEEQNREFWDNGDLVSALGPTRQHQQLLHEIRDVRDGETKYGLVDLAKRNLRDPKGGLLYVAYGANHIHLLDEVERVHGSQIIIDKGAYPEAGELGEVDFSVQSEDTDLLLAQSLLGHFIMARIGDKFHELGRLDIVSLRFEDIFYAVHRVVERLDYQEIDRICRERVNLLEYARDCQELEFFKSKLVAVT